MPVPYPWTTVLTPAQRYQVVQALHAIEHPHDDLTFPGYPIARETPLYEKYLAQFNAVVATLHLFGLDIIYTR